MTTSELIILIFVFMIAGTLFVISIRSFKNRGFLFNNAYLYASKEERDTMDKKPYYKQTAIVCLILCFVFTIIGVSILLQNSKINLIEIPFFAGIFIYAIVSSNRINKKK
ncbi:MAG: DUF3784 domain-containing protein [Ruminococcus sp.]|nr:DUF3784 domain-containing protein [Ruminococcus sp.]